MERFLSQSKTMEAEFQRKVFPESGIVSIRSMSPVEKTARVLGLAFAIVKEIINAHKQNINVISTVGVGTEFIFTLEKAK